MTTLDGKERTLTPEHLVIADRDQPTVIAGVMGAAHVEVTDQTTDLLLEKMQIVEINLKDFKDTIVLLLEHPLSHRDRGPKSIDTDYLVDIMRQDWGFYYTFTTNLKRVPEHFGEFPSIREDQRGVVEDRINALLEAIEAAPKTFGWKMRAKIGTRSRWYQEVSEKSEQY